MRAALRSAPGPVTGVVPRWHFVGRLQSRKCRSVASYAHAVHSVDRPNWSTVSTRRGRAQLDREPLEVFVQVSLDGDPGARRRGRGRRPAPGRRGGSRRGAPAAGRDGGRAARRRSRPRLSRDSAEISARGARTAPRGRRDLGRNERGPRTGRQTRLDTRACRIGVARPRSPGFRLASAQHESRHSSVPPAARVHSDHCRHLHHRLRRTNARSDAQDGRLPRSGRGRRLGRRLLRRARAGALPGAPRRLRRGALLPRAGTARTGTVAFERAPALRDGSCRRWQRLRRPDG